MTTDVSGGTFLDTHTGLEWQTGDADVSNTSLEGAVGHCAGIAASGVRWRLPTRIELASYYDFTRTTRAGRYGTAPGISWTSESALLDTTWLFDLSDGTVTDLDTAMDADTRAASAARTPRLRPLAASPSRAPR